MEKGCFCKSVHAMDAKQVRLLLPADDGMLGVARMTASAVAAQSGLDIEAVEDLKVAVAEACHVILHQAKQCLQLVISFDFLPGALYVQIQGMRAVPCVNEGGAPADTHVSKGIFEMLVDDVRFERDGCGIHTVVLMKNAPEA